MTTFLWRGSTAGGEKLDALSSDASNAANFNWNYPGNWLEQKSGYTAGSTSGVYYCTTDKVPGYGDRAYYGNIYVGDFGAYGLASATGSVVSAQQAGYGNGDYANSDMCGIPLCSLKFGGVSQYGNTGYVNALRVNPGSGNSKDLREFRVMASAGFSGNSGFDARGTSAGSIIGCSIAERKILRDNSIGTSTLLSRGGVDMGGTVDSLRIHARTLDINAQGDFTAKFADTNVYAMFVSLAGGYGASAPLISSGNLDLDFAGGTCQAIFLERTSENDSVGRLPGSSYRFRHDTFVNQPGLTGHKLTDIKIVIIENAHRDCSMHFECVNSIQDFRYTPFYRPKVCKVYANVDRCDVGPEKMRALVPGGRPPDYNIAYPELPYNTLVFSGGGGTRTIGKLRMLAAGFGLDVNDQLYNTTILDGKYNPEYDLGDEFDSSGVDPRNPAEIKGANSLVGFENGTFVVEELSIQGGRLIVGDWNLGADGESVGRRGIQGKKHTITINSGEVHNNGTIDTRHPKNVSYKGFKIGAGITHPRDRGGIQFVGSDADVILADDHFIVLDMISGGTGTTYDGNYILPEIN